jgi:hypothetical protein
VIFDVTSTDVYVAIPGGVAVAAISVLGWWLYKKRGDKGEPPLPPPTG